MYMSYVLENESVQAKMHIPVLKYITELFLMFWKGGDSRDIRNVE